jgi:hypothetical protein
LSSLLKEKWSVFFFFHKTVSLLLQTFLWRGFLEGFYSGWGGSLFAPHDFIAFRYLVRGFTLCSFGFAISIGGYLAFTPVQ